MVARLLARSERTYESSTPVQIRRGVSSLGARDPIVGKAIANIASNWPVDDPTNMRLRTNAIYGEIRRLDRETLPTVQANCAASTPRHGSPAAAGPAAGTDIALPLGVC